MRNKYGIPVPSESIPLPSHEEVEEQTPAQKAESDFLAAAEAELFLRQEEGDEMYGGLSPTHNEED